MFKSLLAIAWLLLAAAPARADLIDLTPVGDTTLSENFPNNNLGGITFFNTGTTQNLTKNRGLMRFDLSVIPAGSRISDASLILSVIHTPADGFTFADFAVHRVLKSWGEGAGMSPTNGNNPGSGAFAKTNEANWFYRFAFTTNTWTTPGAAATNDYVPDISSSQTIYRTGDSPYTFASTPLMTADTQLWLDHPELNFGWILVCESEDAGFTARRFGSREDPGNAPILEINYSPFQIDSVDVANGQVNLHFTAFASQSCSVEYANQLASTNWTTLTNIPAPATDTTVVVSDTTAQPQRYYRLRVE